MLRSKSLCLFVLFALSLAARSAQAQTSNPLHSATEPIQVSGLLRYERTGQPAAEVLVRLESYTGGVVAEVRTDRLGKFRFQNLQPIQYNVVIRHPGYREIQREVNLVMTSADYVQLSLVPDDSAKAAPPLPSSKVLDANAPPEALREFEKGHAALAANKKEKIAEGVQHLEKAVALYPNFLEAHLKLGVAYMDLQQWDKAEQTLKRALEINPRTANAQFALGEIYWRQKRYDEAEKTLKAGLAVEDRSWQGHFTLGRLYLGRGDLAKAGRQIALTIQLNPNLAEAHLLAGNMLLRAGKREDALEQFQEYLRLAPKGELAQQVRETVQKMRSAPAQK
jgi:tetratricopeptide (TPR) repeat protein